MVSVDQKRMTNQPKPWQPHRLAHRPMQLFNCQTTTVSNKLDTREELDSAHFTIAPFYGVRKKEIPTA